MAIIAQPFNINQSDVRGMLQRGNLAPKLFSGYMPEDIDRFTYQ
jgi:hypothetical protein